VVTYSSLDFSVVTVGSAMDEALLLGVNLLFMFSTICDIGGGNDQQFKNLVNSNR
jgi:hypothetical protein